MNLYANAVAAERAAKIARDMLDHEAGIEAMRQRITELERELETERCLSFRNQVAELEQQLAAATSQRDGLNRLCEFNEITMARLQQQLAAVREDLHFQAFLTREFMPYQERAVLAEQQVTLLRDVINTIKNAARELMADIDNALDNSEFDRIDTKKWNALGASIAATESKP